MGMARLFTAGQLGHELNLHPDTIKKYEDAGIISPAYRDKNNWRRYTLRHKGELIRLLTDGKHETR